MRFGVSGDLLPANMDDLTPAVAARIRDLGFSGVFTRFRANDPFATTAQQCRRCRGVLEDAGLRMYQATGYWQCLVHPEDAPRRQAVRTLQQALRVAGWLGARGIDTGPGSLNPRGPWFPHPDNWTARSRDQLVKSLRECAPTAEDAGVYLSLEGHQLVTLDTAETTRQVLDAVASPWVRSDFDPVNWLTLRSAFATGPAIEQMLDTLGHHVVSAHAKDLIVEDRLTLHMTERPAGQGWLDYPTLLARMETLDPDYPVIVEGATAAQMPAVKEFLDGVAAALGIVVRS
jgi:sugar phosphate isomerase/epimerase